MAQPPPPHPITIPLPAARRSLESPQALRALVNCLDQLSEKSIEYLGPLVFEVLTLGDEFPVAELLADILNHRPEWRARVNKQSYNLLMEAVFCNRLDLLDVLIDAGVDTAHKNKAGFGVLDVATAVKAAPAAQEALGNALLGKGVFSIIEKDKALNSAAHNGNLGMTRSLLAHGAGFASVLPPGATLAEAAALNDDKYPAVEIVSALLQAKAGRDLIDEGWATPDTPPPINRAAFNGNLGVIAVLLETGARLDPPENLQSGTGETPLMSAAYGLQPEAIDLLLKSGSAPDTLNIHGCNALHYLADHLSWQGTCVEQPLMLRAISLLVAAGTDPQQADTAGRTPLDIAVLRGDANVIESFTVLHAQTLSRGLAANTQHPGPARPGPSPPRI